MEMPSLRYSVRQAEFLNYNNHHLTNRSETCCTNEMLSQVLSHCQSDYALAISAGLSDTFWRQVVKGDVARHRLAVAIQATQLLQKQTHDEYYGEDVIELSGKMVARFVSLGSEVYLRDIVKRCEYIKVSDEDVEFRLDKPPKLLAIQADHLGVRNVAFRQAPDGTPEFLRNGRLPLNMFVDRVDESFAFLRIVYDVSCWYFCERRRQLNLIAY
jgi:hypothetical protein